MGTNNADDEDDDVDVDEARLRGGAGGGQTVNPAIVANNAGGPPGGPGNIMDGITVGGDDDGMNVEVGGDRFDHQRIRMAGADGNGEMGMLDAM